MNRTSLVRLSRTRLLLPHILLPLLSTFRHFSCLVSLFFSQVTFNVYSDFDEHWGKRTNATYIREKGTGFKGIHSVKMVGFGTGSDGVDYWTCENSWGVSGGFGFPGFAQGGYFRIRRGTNECGIEKLAYAGWPVLM